MSPSFKVGLPAAALFISSVSASINFLYPKPGSTDLVLKQGDNVIVSWETDLTNSGFATNNAMTLDCGTSPDFAQSSRKPLGVGVKVLS